ncbi:MAG: O-methyltransferase [Halobacteriales archaeon]
MSDVHTALTGRVLDAMAPAADGTLATMADHAAATDYPVVGPQVGRLLAVLTRLAGVERAFEFGSGFGYSAYWIARAMPDGGEVVLTDVDTDHLDRARNWFADAGLTGRARFEPGDAHETIERYDGPFDLVLLDHYNRHYVDALAAARDRLAPGGLVIADNALSGGSVYLEDIVAALDGGTPETNANTRGTVDFLETLADDPTLETTLLPLGDGVSVSVGVG